MSPPSDDPIRPHDPEIGIFAYLLALSSFDEPPNEFDRTRPGDLRRRSDGGYWIFDGDCWIEW